MKLLTSFLALTALTLAASAFGQEESPSASPSDQEKTSATVETTPEATKSTSTAEETTTTLPAAEKKEQPSATATPGAKKTATEPKKAAAEAGTKPGKKMGVEATIKDNETRWEAAIASHNVAAIEAMVASDFMGVSAKGKFLNKSGLVSEQKADKDTYKSAKLEKMNVRSFDKDVVVVTGSAREKGTGKDGKSFDRTYLYTDTWVQRNGQWLCVASQVALHGQK